MIGLLPKDGSTIDLMPWWFRFTLDASTDYLFGESVESLLYPKVALLILPLRRVDDCIDGIRGSVLENSGSSNLEISNWPFLETLSSKEFLACNARPE